MFTVILIKMPEKKKEKRKKEKSQLNRETVNILRLSEIEEARDCPTAQKFNP